MVNVRRAWVVFVACAALSACSPEMVAALAPVATGVLEARVRAEAAASGASMSDPRVLAAIEAARKADAAEAKRAAKRAAESAKRDEETAALLTSIARTLAEVRRSCPPVDAGTDGAP